MATSGTWSFDLDIGDIIEEAFERVGREARYGYDFTTARRSLDLLMLEWQNRGLNLWTVKSASQALTASTASYTLSADKLDIIEGTRRENAGDVTNQTDITMRRVSVSSYSQQTNKLQQGAPIQYYVERGGDGLLTVYMWPVPDSNGPYTFHYYYMERIEDTGTPASNNMDVPARFLPALTCGLAYQIALKTRDIDPNRVAKLEQEYEKQWELAADSAREKATLRLIGRTY